MTEMGPELPVWRNIYKILGEAPSTAGPDKIRTCFTTAGAHLFVGLTVYGPYTNDSLYVWKPHLSMLDETNFESIIHLIAIQLNLDCSMAEKIFEHFVMYGCHVSPKDIMRLAENPEYRIELTNKVWQFYCTERIFLLKTQRKIIEIFKDPCDANYDIYKEFVDKYGVPEFKECLMREYIYLVHELRDDLMPGNYQPKKWVDRNSAETIEVLIALIHFSEGVEYLPHEIVSVMFMFAENDFGRRPLHEVRMSDEEDLQIILLLQYGVFLAMIERLWASTQWLQEIKALERLMTHEVTKGHDAIVLIWTVLMLSLPPNLIDPTYATAIEFQINTYFRKEIFDIFMRMVELPILYGSSTQVILKKSLYPLISLVAERTREQYLGIMQTSSCIPLLASLMEVDDIYTKCMDPKNAIHGLLIAATEIFPYDFHSLTDCALVILKHNRINQKVIDVLLNLEVYAEKSPTTYMHSHIITGEEKQYTGFVIPDGTLARVNKLSNRESLLMYSGKFKYTYFNILAEHLSKTFFYFVSITNLRSDRDLVHVKCSIVGLKLIAKLLKIGPNLVKNIWFDRCVGYGKVLLCLLLKMDHPNYELFEQSFSTCIQASYVIDCDIPGLIKNVFYEDMIKKSILHQQRMSKLNTFKLFATIWETSAQSNHEPEDNRFPGLVYFLREVFPNHMLWEFNSDFDKTQLGNDILRYILRVLYNSYSTNIGKYIYNFCVDTVLNYTPFIKTLLLYIRLPNCYLEQLMCREPFWTAGRSVQCITVVWHCMQILIWVFRIIDYEEIKDSQLWQLLHRSANKIIIARPICDFLNHTIVRSLPGTALVLLTLFCQHKDIDMLTSLEMDYYQVQELFLNRLRDPYVDFDFKMNILLLVKQCLPNQIGMTAAFFNYSIGNQYAKDVNDIGIFSYFVEYLMSIKNQPKTLNDTMQRGVLELLHIIWTNKKRFLIENLIKLDYFWEILATPILIYHDYNIFTYIHVLEILGTELSKRQIDQNLSNLLLKVFASNSGFIKHFPIYVMKQVTIDTESAMDLLNAWRMFMVYVAKWHGAPIPDGVKTALIESTMDAMRFFIQFKNHSVPFSHYSQLYLSLISYWSEASYGEGTFMEWAEFMTYISQNCYHYAANICKEAVVGIAIKIVEHFEDIFRSESPSAEKFLLAMMEIIETEYDSALLLKRNLVVLKDDYIPWGLLTKFTSLFLSYKNRYKWVYFSQMLEKTFVIVGHLASHDVLMPLAQISLQFIINYIKSPMYENFYGVNVQDLYDSIKFPEKLLDCTPLGIQGSDPKPYEQFWLTFTCLMNMNLTIIQRFHNVVLPGVIEYLDMHKKEIYQIFKLPFVTRHTYALKCVSSTMFMCTFMLRWRVTIYSFEEPSIPRYYKVISECFKATVTILLRPVIKRESSFENVGLEERLPVGFLTDITERLADILGASCLGLLDITPELLHTFQCGDFTAAEYWDCIYEFHIPFVMTPSKALWLTFEQILRMAHYLCITLAKKVYIRPDYTGWVCLLHYNRPRATRNKIYQDFDYYERYVNRKNL